ncbi:MAG: tRNA 5-methoxyuridine(34)/uridine 5-oxyacetic acid(34) synthase CmoB [Pseudomonadales bacterium]|nr:tRNA 5-methoxyuridine(34)/uridine 5-oxyacetic acid(34) synthase CmoB [Pseudomonadales bacterium]MCP5357691.1 tRNA 5-methoxyuridine(34)/uridine 5-oxyacetic acid(34) synthase CmoB [Pseudomonadales bacterium]
MLPIAYANFPGLVASSPLEPLLRFSRADWFGSRNNGDYPKWRDALQAMPELAPGSIDLLNAVRIGSRTDCSPEQQQQLRRALEVMIPWRKGPFSLFGVDIDTEWRSDWKWDRLREHISPLQGRTILDVGSGNGYHCFRMAGAGARLAVGVDTQLAYAMQFQAVKRYVPDAPVFVLPNTFESLLDSLGEEPESFDTVFSMGVLYHRRSPIDHLLQLKSCLRPGGELVLETLIVDGAEGYALTPHDRYSRMPNVWFLPSCDTAVNWLQRCGYTNPRVVDVNVTSLQEQRTTDWMRFQSLVDCLDPDDHSRTVEGLPAPKRAVFVATKP